MSVFVIRHADKEPGDFYSSDLPMNNQPISEKGKLQALNLVEYFREIDIASIHVSPYIRTQQTISEVTRLKKITPKIDPRLGEINIGDLDKLTDEQIERSHPEFWKAYLERDRDFRFPNGESGDDAGTRIFEMFCELDPPQNHILVAHDGIIRVLICKVLGMPVYRRHLFRIDLASITVFDYNLEFRCWTIPRINMVLGESAGIE